MIWITGSDATGAIGGWIDKINDLQTALAICHVGGAAISREGDFLGRTRSVVGAR